MKIACIGLLIMIVCYAQEEILLLDVERIDLDTMLELFSLEERYEQYIHSNKVHQGIVSKFVAHGIPLSLDANVSSTLENNKLHWDVHDLKAQQEYRINKYNQRLYVFLKNYPIWPELSLRISGHLLWDIPSEITITTKIFYKETLACQFISRCSPGQNFIHFWPQINHGEQIILPGMYRIVLAVEKEKQTSSLQKWWQQNWGQRRVKEIHKDCLVSTENYARQNIQSFYMHRLQSLNHLFLQIKETHKNSCLANRQPSEWDVAKLKFFLQIRREFYLIEKQKQRTFPLVYPQVDQMLRECHQSLFVLCEEITNHLNHPSHILSKQPYDFTSAQVYLKKLQKKCLLQLREK